MAEANAGIDQHYEDFYGKTNRPNVYPTEFVVRTFLAHYPQLAFPGLLRGDRVLDIGFGDGRNTTFLCQQGFRVSGVEITQGIVDLASERMRVLGHDSDLRVGRNSSMPFDNDYFDCILACHSCYYCDEGETLADNLREYSRVLKPSGFLVASVARRDSYIFEGAEELADGSLRITRDPYGNRNGYRLHAFATQEELKAYFSQYFSDFSIGYAENDYYGIAEKVYWVVCRKKSSHD